MSEMGSSPVWKESRVQVPDVDTRGGGVAAAAAIAGKVAAATAAANIAARRAPSPRRRRSIRPRCVLHLPVISLRRLTILDRRGAIQASQAVGVDGARESHKMRLGSYFPGPGRAHRTVRRRPQVGER